MRVMGLDLGEKRIGIAVSDPLGWTAQGITVLARGEDTGRDMAAIAALARQHGVERVVVGLPRHLNGSIGVKAQEALDFAVALREALNLPVDTWDERLTTKAAERTLIAGNVSRKNRRKVIDKMAAVIMLQGYLDRHAAKGYDQPSPSLED